MWATIASFAVTRSRCWWRWWWVALVYAFSYLGILIAIGRRVDLLETSLQLVFPATAYNTVLMLVLSPVLYRRLDRRRA
ncbi:MAG: hypothetical protein R2856_14415 [Caldilineaceae bacterium]